MTNVITGLSYLKKMKMAWQTAGLLFVCLFIASNLLAQENRPVTYLGLEQGLSNNGVTDIFQDKNGFMWFSTYEGLNKYDGYDFTIFKNKIGDSTSLVGNLMHTINGDNTGRIWIGGQRGASILYPSTSTFSSPYYKTGSGSLRPVTDEVHIIKSAAKLGMLIGTVQSGLLLFEGNTTTGKQIVFGTDTAYDVPAIYYDSLRTQAYVFIRNTGLCTFSFQTQKLQIINTQFNRQINFLRVDKLGRLWMGNEQGLYLYDFAANTFSANIMPLECIVADLDEDKEGNLWVGSNGEGIWKIPAGTITPSLAFSVDGISPLNSNAVATLYVDADGRKWIGTMRGGINKVEAVPLPFKKILYDVSGKNASLANFINAFCEDDQGNIWIGTSGAGLRYWNRQTGIVKEFVHENKNTSSLSSSFPTGIIQDANKDIWVSTWHGGVNRYNKAKQDFEHFPCYNPTKKQEERNIWFLFEDSQKKLWASATNNNGSLYLFNRAANRFEPFDNNITNIQVMAEDKQGRLWVGNYSSLILLDPAQKKHVFYDLKNTVRSIIEGKDGSFWVGTQGGGLLLFNRNTGKYQQFTTSDGLPGNSVLRILEDHSGNLWFSSFNGLTRFSPTNKKVTNFSTSDGLQSTQFSFNAGLQLRSGEMLFGGIKGFNLFYPDSVQTRSWMPPLRLTGIRISNQPVQENLDYLTQKDAYAIRQITLPYDKAAIAIDFAALEFSSPDKIHYSYFLDGWDNGWNMADNSRTANYTRLTEGHYTLRIKNTNAKGEWNKQEILLQITVLPPWYRSWWAYTLYIYWPVLPLCGCIYGIKENKPALSTKCGWRIWTQKKKKN
jgi:ligand-binding sensor domain-containing protein